MRATRAVIGLVITSLACLTAAYAAGMQSNPDASAMFLLQCKFAHTVPPYEAMALSEATVSSADEFRRPEAIRQNNATLTAKAATLEGVNQIIVNLGSHLSEYDTQYSEYDFDINDASYISYNAFGHQVRLVLTNGTKAQIWKLPVKDAEDALRKNKGDRYATLVLTLALLDSPPAIAGDPMVLNARILRYDVLTHFGNVRLGSVTVENAP